MDEFSDDDGYAYRFELDDFTIDVTEDVANAKPGEVHLFVTYTASGRLLNRTPQRNANVPEIDYGVIWLANSPFCKGSTGAVAPAFYGDPEAEEAYCKISNAAGFPVGEPLQVGEERVLPLKGGNIPPIVVAESDVSNVKASLLDPYAQVVGRRNYGTWNPEPFDCGMKNNQGYLTAASAEIVGCSRFT